MLALAEETEGAGTREGLPLGRAGDSGAGQDVVPSTTGGESRAT